jgi:hypothetical protein
MEEAVVVVLAVGSAGLVALLRFPTMPTYLFQTMNTPGMPLPLDRVTMRTPMTMRMTMGHQTTTTTTTRMVLTMMAPMTMMRMTTTMTTMMRRIAIRAMEPTI